MLLVVCQLSRDVIITLAITIGKRSQAKVKLFLSAGKCTGTSQECCGFYVVECLTKWQMFCQNSPRSIYLNSNMIPRLSGHFSIISLIFFVLKSLLGIAILSLKPRSHDRILIYRTWAKKQQEVIFLYKLIKGKCVCRNYFRHKRKWLYDKKCFSWRDLWNMMLLFTV